MTTDLVGDAFQMALWRRRVIHCAERLIADGDRSSRAATFLMLKPCSRLTWIVARPLMQNSEYELDTTLYRCDQVLHSEFSAKVV
ncbi:hypothetical protein SAMN05660971_03960 [Halomonas cupida]|uniref:Uncharacterized protein n=1 Tax=Halomonas cupida TaxID=44933 RepID=A0A1M7LVA6_9GAMM|nr:hypothetical protein SAMN05660971_03960 [Halomonas cupida]